MTKLADMPSDILNAAAIAVNSMPERTPRKAEVLVAIAHAIFNERERCAKVADEAKIKVFMHWDADCEQPIAQPIAHREVIARAIRKGSSEKGEGK